MTNKKKRTTMPAEELPPGSPDLSYRAGAVLFVDVAGSMDLTKRDQVGYVLRWREIRLQAEAVIAAVRGAEFVKSTGDGFCAVFPTARAAVDAARRFHEIAGRISQAASPEDAVLLRIGVHLGRYIRDEVDCYGDDVNIAGRLREFPSPGETIISAETQDHLTADLDGEIEDLGFLPRQDAAIDLGFVYPKGAEPIRVYRIGPPGRPPRANEGPALGIDLRPTLAVLPFRWLDDSTASLSFGTGQVPPPFGDLIAEGVIGALSTSWMIRVISRLSSARFHGRQSSLEEISGFLNATYILSGSFTVDGGMLILNTELSDARTGGVAWAERIRADARDLLQPESELLGNIAHAVHLQVFESEMQHTRRHPLPWLESYSLLFGGINRMHRSGVREFDEARRMLEELVKRHAHAPTPRAWLAQWYVLRSTRGLSPDRAKDAQIALDITARALDADPTDSLAMATQGFVHCHLLKDLDKAQTLCEQAVGVNPSQALGWLYNAVIHAFKGNGQASWDAAQRSIALSPIDPQRYYFESLAATAAVSAKDFARAQVLAESSLKRNRLHSSTWRMLTVALVEQGKIDEARAAMDELRKLEPQLTTAGYLARMPNGQLETGRAWARAMATAGLPPGN